MMVVFALSAITTEGRAALACGVLKTSKETLRKDMEASLLGFALTVKKQSKQRIERTTWVCSMQDGSQYSSEDEELTV